MIKLPQEGMIQEGMTGTREEHVLLAAIWPIPSRNIHWLLKNSTFGEIPVSLASIWSLPSVVSHMG